MRFDYEKHHRRSIRLKGYDYTRNGAYFATLVTQDRSFRFGDVADGVMQPNDAGRMVQTVWDELPTFYPGVLIDKFVVMPNHIHGIIVLVGAGPCACPGPGPCPIPGGRPIPRTGSSCGPDGPSRIGWIGSSGVDRDRSDELGPGPGQAQGPAPTGMAGMTVGDIMHRFKTMTTKRYADGVTQQGWPAFRGRLWQRNYYEHIVRDDAAMQRIRRYIGDNPWRWDQDDENPLKAPL